MTDSLQLLDDVENSLVSLSDREEPLMDLVTLSHVNDSGEEETIEYQRRTEFTNIVTVGFDDDTVYELAVAPELYDRLKSSFETCEDLQDVIVDTTIDDDPTVE